MESNSSKKAELKKHSKRLCLSRQYDFNKDEKEKKENRRTQIS
jgi:hypothetical protein